MPAVRAAMLELQAENQQLHRLRRQARGLTAAMRGNGHAGEARELEARISDQLAILREKVAAISDMGVLVKDIDMGLVDFPSNRDGRTVLLCWLIEESDIRYWHHINDGFQGRRPL